MGKNAPVKLHKTNKEAGKYAGSPAKPDSGAEYAPRDREETHKNGGKQLEKIVEMCGLPLTGPAESCKIRRTQ